MTMHQEQLIAYLATLLAIVVVILGALVFAAFNNGIMSNLDAFGLGTVTGGLIGVIRLPQQRSVTVDNTRADPVKTEEMKA